MNISLIPTHDPCTEEAHAEAIARDSFVCPFDNICEGMQDPMPHTCHFPGSFLMANLASYGFIAEAITVSQDLSASEATQFGQRLEQVIEDLDALYPEAEQGPDGAFLWAQVDADGKDIPTRSDFPEALSMIEGAAAWYQTLGEHGSGVHACTKGFVPRACETHPKQATVSPQDQD